MSKRYCIVTAIPYVNSVPHIGTVLTTLTGDVMARYMRLKGKDVYYVAGADENGLKIKEAAEKNGRDPIEFVAEISGRFQTIFKGLGIRYDEFIRTTEERHAKTCQAFFKKLQDNGYIYKGSYAGWYDVSTETFFREEDLVDGKSPDGNEVRWVEEENYFFKLSAFEAKLLDIIESGRMRIIPETRKNEVLSFIKQGLRDTCISRQNPGWGIPVPGDEKQVIYVWFDALINYITATGWPEKGYEKIWPADVQWLGKDILTRFHATLWPAMLMGVGLEVPHALVGHGWILLSGDKISKSRGNVVAPLELAKDLAERSTCTNDIAIDAVRYQILSTMPYDSDMNFTYEDFDLRYNTDLANDLGNALNRSLAMAHKFIDGVIPDCPIEPDAQQAIEDAKTAYSAAFDDFRIDRATTAAWGLVRFINKYIDTRAPWALAKAEDPAVKSVMRSTLLCLRAVEALVRPMMPTTADTISTQLGLTPLMVWDEIGDLTSLPVGTALEQPKPIFPRLDLSKAKAEAKSKPQPPKKEKKVEPKPEPIAIDDFAKVELRVARVLEAEAIEGSDKLLKLQVMIGEEKRQIVAGIRKSYQPVDLIGRQIIVVANLKPASLRGVESQGMLLAATDKEGAPILLQPENEALDGSRVR
jgi:methionyl-tRNA synthetase